jgi:hypothetical protein
VVGEAERAAGVVEQGRGELAENEARRGVAGTLTIGVVGAKVDELEGEGVMVGSVLTSVSWTMDLSVLASSSLRLGPSPVLSLLNLLPPGSYTRLWSQMLLLVLLVPRPLSRALRSVLLSFVSSSLLHGVVAKVVAVIVAAVLYSCLLRLRCRGGFRLDGFRDVGTLLFVMAIRLEFDGFGLGFSGFGGFGRFRWRGGE